MCLAIPAEVIEIGEGSRATVDFLGVRRSAEISLVPDVEVGDYVLLHAGFAIEKLDKEEALETLAIHRELAEMNYRDELPEGLSET